MTRIKTGLTAEELYARLDQPEPPTDRTTTVPRTTTYRCGNTIYTHRTDWAITCAKHDTPINNCDCNKRGDAT